VLWFIHVFLLAQTQQIPQQTFFHQISKREVPRQLIVSKNTCLDPDTPAECLDRFKEGGRVWAGDVNGDGVEELLIEPGTGGSAGDDEFLFQRVGDKWRMILSAFPYLERTGILPIVRDGYHDLYLDSLHCFKWSNRKYIPYETGDYRKLRLEYFGPAKTEDAAILWLARYAGLHEFQFQPTWVRSTNQTVSATKLADPGQQLTWVAEFKGSVWGVRGDKKFLILPRPDYRGCERLELDGDWLVIYGEEDDLVARFNRKTQKMLIMEGNDPYWLSTEN
jgi:hypothetical protein